jgi:hypothetical protein
MVFPQADFMDRIPGAVAGYDRSERVLELAV